MLELMEMPTGNLVSIRASGTVAGDDYEGLLIPAIKGEMDAAKEWIGG